MHCKKVQTLFFQLLENELDDSHKNEASAHLDQCQHCASLYKSFSQTLHSVNSFSRSTPETTDYFTSKTLLKIQNLKNQDTTVWSWISGVLFKKPAVMTASFAAMFSGVVLGIFLNLNYQDSISTENISDNNSVEEVYYAGTSDNYMLQFIENQYYKENGNK